MQRQSGDYYDMTNRRKFLTRAAGAVAAVGIARPDSTAYITPPGWFDKPMRWAQLVFTEDDPGNYDQQFWLDYFKRTHSEGACLAGGGYMAFYPTKIPLHYRSKFLGHLDPLGGLVKGCRALGMNVIARTDPHAAHQDLYDAHPDWIAVDAQGRKRRHWANPELWVTCALGPMNFDFMTQVNDEIVRMYGVDGIFSNRWSGSGQCFCEHCQKNFRDFSGHDLPRTADPQDPARKAYIVWREQRLFELWRLWDSGIRKINPNARFIPNAGGGALSDLDMKTVGEMADILFADRQSRRGVMPPWANGKNGKEYRAGLGSKPIGGIFSVGIEEPYRWKDSVQNGDEIRLWATDGIANGLRPWFTKFNGKPYDKRWLEPVAELYDWHYRNERYLRNEQNLARVAVVFSQQTAKFYGGEQARAKCEDAIQGFYQALIESRIPFEMVHDRKLDAENVSRFKTLVLPNIAALSAGQCAQLRDFVKRGGSLVATNETSLYDEWGVRRANFGLADVFGARFDGAVVPRIQNSYIWLEHPHPLLKGLEDTPRIIDGTSRVKTVADGSEHSPMTLVPSYPDLPMEDVYPRIPRTTIPMVHIRESGGGRVVYFPFDLDRTFWEVLAGDHLTLLRNAVDWATNEEPPVFVAGPGVLDITVWRQRDSMTVHLVNLTNPMMMKG
ncbi:MAG: beta-galactosidase trimerization domain-containing protein, partial [Bryobacteraceae bacterium]